MAEILPIRRKTLFNQSINLLAYQKLDNESIRLAIECLLNTCQGIVIFKTSLLALSNSKNILQKQIHSTPKTYIHKICARCGNSNFFCLFQGLCLMSLYLLFSLYPNIKVTLKIIKVDIRHTIFFSEGGGVCLDVCFDRPYLAV